MKKILNLFLAGALAVSAVGAVDFVRPTAAYAAAGCLFDYDNNYTTMKIYNVSCASGSSVRPWIKYNLSDNNPRVYTRYGAIISSGTSTATRPGGTLYYSAGHQTFF